MRGVALLATVLFQLAFGDDQTLPNSCIDLEDGEHYLKLLEGDDYPVLKVQCSNGYMLIDYSSDSDWQYYFSTFLKWHYEIGGPSQDDHYNWAEWYLPSDSQTNYIISPDCDVCDEDVQDDYRNTNGLQSGYYMNANFYGMILFVLVCLYLCTFFVFTQIVCDFA